MPYMTRANGEGSEPRRRKDGLYQSNYTMYVDDVLKLKSVYACTKDLSAGASCGRQSPRGMAASVDTKNLTIRSYLETWLIDSVKGSVKIRTYEHHHWCMYRRIVPWLSAQLATF